MASKADKYISNWQFFRVSLKGLSWSDKESKIETFRHYFFTASYKDILINYVRGCMISEKDPVIKTKMASYLYSLTMFICAKTLAICEFQTGDYAQEDIKKVFLDLFNRNKRWLSRGYIHKKQNNYVDSLLEHIEDCAFRKKYILLLRDLRKQAGFTTNTHKFIY